MGTDDPRRSNTRGNCVVGYHFPWHRHCFTSLKLFIIGRCPSQTIEGQVMTTPILSIENLAVIFKQPSGDVYAVRDVSFDLHKGEILGIVGESGSGKTVTCRSILQLLPNNAQITSGHIYLDGNKDLLTLTSVELSKLRGERISMIFQSPSTYLDPLMTSGHQ